MYSTVYQGGQPMEYGEGEGVRGRGTNGKREIGERGRLSRRALPNGRELDIGKELRERS